MKKCKFLKFGFWRKIKDLFFEEQVRYLSILSSLKNIAGQIFLINIFAKVTYFSMIKQVLYEGKRYYFYFS